MAADQQPGRGRRRRTRGIRARLVLVALLPVLLAAWFGVDAARGRFEVLDSAESRRQRTEALVALADLRSQVLGLEAVDVGLASLAELDTVLAVVESGFDRDRAPVLAMEALDTLDRLDLDELAGRPALEELRGEYLRLRTSAPLDVGAIGAEGPDAVIAALDGALAPALDFVADVDEILLGLRSAAAPTSRPDALALAQLSEAELLAFEEGVAVSTELLRALVTGELDPVAALDPLALGATSARRVADLRAELPVALDATEGTAAVMAAEDAWSELRQRFAVTTGLRPDLFATVRPLPFDVASLSRAAQITGERMAAFQLLRHDLAERLLVEADADARAARDDLALGFTVAGVALLLTLVVGALVIGRLLRNLRLLHDRAEAVGRGELAGPPLRLRGDDESVVLGDAFDSMTAAVAARVAESESFASSLLAATDEAILTIDHERILSANHAALELLGRAQVQVVGMSVASLAERFPLLADLPVGITNADAAVIRADGSERHVVVTTRVTGSDDRPVVAVFARDITDRKQLQDRLAHQATHDDLTGLANRASLVAELERAAARADRHGHGHGLLFVDLDRFKLINDTLGHRAGDLVLQEVAGRLRTATRETDLVARNGGDEFVVLAEEASDITTLVRLAERIQAELSRPVAVGEDTIPVSASIGVTWLDLHGGAGIDQLRDADVAMYHAKASGPGQIRVFDDDLRELVEQRFDLERELRRAVGIGALDAHIQPVVDLRRGRISGGELLCRWTTEDGREVPPDAFIEVAEDSTLVVEIGRWMLDRAAQLLADWARDDLDLDLSVNLSGRHIDHPSVVDDVADACARWGIDPSRMVIEITETSLLRDLVEASATLQRLRDVGVRIAVDDFGVGYASLRYLRELPVELVKIDRSIVAGFGRVDSDTVIVTMLTRLADVLEIAIVAEGIETEDQREQLGELGCDYGQGYLFARPMPTTGFRSWLARWDRFHTHPSAWTRTGS